MQIHVLEPVVEGKLCFCFTDNS